MEQKPFQNIFSKNEDKIKKSNDEIKIIADYREKNSLVIAKLIKLGAQIETKELKVADYLSKNVAIERKTIPDFLASMFNKRLIKQIEEMKQYPDRLLIIEGIEEKEIYNDDNSYANAIRGFLLSIILKHKIPTIFSKNEEDTAKFIYLIAKKQEEMPINARKRTNSKKERIQFIIEGFPGVGPKTSIKLLEKFGTIQNIINAPKEDLKKILGKKSEGFIELIGSKY